MNDEHVMPMTVQGNYPYPEAGHFPAATCPCRPIPSQVLVVGLPPVVRWSHNPFTPLYPSQETS